jgi:hypothetical protein
LNQSINQVYIQQKRTELTELPNLELIEFSYTFGCVYARENNAGRLEKTDCTLVCFNSCTLICTVCVNNYNVVVRLWMQHVVDA